jgi:hypothetical protein
MVTDMYSCKIRSKKFETLALEKSAWLASHSVTLFPQNPLDRVLTAIELQHEINIPHDFTYELFIINAGHIIPEFMMLLMIQINTHLL